MTYCLELAWNGDVPPCPRPRLTRSGKAYMPATYRTAVATIALGFRLQALEAQVDIPIDAPVFVIQRFAGRLHQGRDLDNLAKTCNDALVQADILKSDNLKRLDGILAVYGWEQEAVSLRVQVWPACTPAIRSLIIAKLFH